MAFTSYLCMLVNCADAGATGHCRLRFRSVLPRIKRNDAGGTARGGGNLGETPYEHGAEGARAAARQTALLFP